ncbi:MAG: GH1 family beta-glucosidase [Bacteroidota bacterium]
MEEKTNPLNRGLFGNDFKWGVSTAAFQIEGNHDTDGKGHSIWDVFTAQKGRIKNGHHAQTACNFYNSYPDDIKLLKELNIPHFRFSISWSRIMPTGQYPINQKGIDHYNRVIDCLLENGIEPWVTLYHWDLPHELELKGGWTNREVVTWFEEFVEVCSRSFGDRVKNWMVINEPSVFTGAGYFLGIHAPGKRGINNYLKAVHHVTLATAAGGRILHKNVKNGHIGTTFSCTYVEAATSKKRDIAAAKRVDTLLNRAFIEPILGLGYPIEDLPVVSKILKYVLPGDLENMAFDFDFIGLQCYTREVVKASILTPYVGAALVKAEKRNVPLTEMKWEVYPESIYHMLKKFNAYKQVKKIIITENGAAFPDVVIDGNVADPLRSQYLQDHLKQVLKAKNEGVPVEGYFVWTLTDNFEWAEGYHTRFGLVYVDFDTQERIVKQSGKWYADFLSDNNSF